MANTAITDKDKIEIIEQLRIFGANLRAERQAAGLTQTGLGALAPPLDHAAISKLEWAERAPDFATLMRLSTALNVKPGQLVKGIGPEKCSRRRVTTKAKTTQSPQAILGANLRWARKRIGVSQESLGNDAKVDRAAISKFENGKAAPNLRTVLKLARRLEVGPDVLVHGIEPR
jgi:transcriptional regulator with XRE-family HTH domain